MKIILKDNKELNPISFATSKRTVHGATRDCLSFTFPDTFKLDEIDSIFTEAACESITAIDDNNTEAVYTAYTIRAELKKFAEVSEPATSESEAVTENHIVVTMAQRTYQETKMKELEAKLNALGV